MPKARMTSTHLAHLENEWGRSWAHVGIAAGHWPSDPRWCLVYSASLYRAALEKAGSSASQSITAIIDRSLISQVLKRQRKQTGCIIKIRGVWEAAGCSVVMEEKLTWPLEEGVLRRPSGSFPWNSLACSLHVVTSQCCHLPLHHITKRILSRVNIYFMYKERQIWYFLSVSRS